MSSKAEEAGMETKEAQETVAASSHETERTETRQNSKWKAIIKHYWKLLVAIAVVGVFFITMLFGFSAIPAIIMNERITAIESQLAHESRVSDIAVYEELINEIRELEQNITNRALQLENNYYKAMRTMQTVINDSETKINQLEGKLVNAEERIAILEGNQLNLTRELAQTKGSVSTIQTTLDIAKEQISRLERNLSDVTARTTVTEKHQDQLTTDHRQTRQELNEIRLVVESSSASITVLKVGLNDTTHRISLVEIKLANTMMNVSLLNTTKASKDELNERIEELKVGKVNKTDFEALSENVSSLTQATSAADKMIFQELSDLTSDTFRMRVFLETVHNTTLAIQEDIDQLTNDHNQTREDVQVIREELHTATASITTLEEGLNETKHQVSTVESELNNTKMEVSSLNETKASKASVEVLEIKKVEKTEFEVLKDNVSSLRETTTAADEDLRQKFKELADNTLNHTHHNELLNSIGNLISWVTTLNESTVKTHDFLHTVNEIHNTTIALQGDIVRLNQTITSLARDTTDALSNKAEQHAVDTLSDELTTLSDTTVRKTTFDSTIGSLSSSKADQSDLESLELRVGQLEDTAAEKNELSSLERTVTNHISDSGTTHYQLSSRITSNDGDISSNRQRIGAVEADIQELKEDSSSGLKPLWSMILVPAVISTYLGSQCITC